MFLVKKVSLEPWLKVTCTSRMRGWNKRLLKIMIDQSAWPFKESDVIILLKWQRFINRCFTNKRFNVRSNVSAVPLRIDCYHTTEHVKQTNLTDLLPDFITASFLLKTQSQVVVFSFGPNDECVLRRSTSQHTLNGLCTHTEHVEWRHKTVLTCCFW